MEEPVEVYHIGPYDEEATCCECGKTGGRGVVVLCGPDHPPYNAEPNYYCLDCVEPGAHIVDHHFETGEDIVFYRRRHKCKPFIRYRGKVVRENRNTVTVELTDPCPPYAPGYHLRVETIQVHHFRKPEIAREEKL